MIDDDELDAVRAQVRDSQLFSPAFTAQIDALRASVHEQLRERDIEPTSPEYERTCVVAGGVVAQLLGSPETMALLASVDNDEQRAGIAALLFWSSGISAHPAESVPR